MKRLVRVLAPVVAPWAYLAAVAVSFPGLGGQPGLVHAQSIDTFTRELAKVGAVNAVRVGIGLDMVFVVWFLAVALERVGPSRRWIPLAAAVSDTVENGLLWAAAGHPSSRLLSAMNGLAVGKLVAYAVTGVMLLAWCDRKVRSR